METLGYERIWNTIGKIIVFLYVFFYGFLYLGYCFIISLLHSSYSIVSVPAIILPFILLLTLLWLRWRGKTTEEKQNSRTIYGTIAVAGFLPVLLMMIALGVNEREDNFSHDRWLTDQDKRVYMVDDLLQNHVLKGMHRQEVYQLLGNPNETEYFKEKNNIVYWLGPERGLIRIDSEWLVIWFDANNHVTHYKITRD